MKTIRTVATVGILCWAVWAGTAVAQPSNAVLPKWAVVDHQAALAVHVAATSNQPTGVFSPIIPRFVRNQDDSGTTESYNTAAPTDTSTNPFFLSLGTNGRACVTCHEPRSAWGVSAASIQERFEASGGNDPIFLPLDGATCSTDDISTLAAKRNAYSLLLSKGLIRVFLPMPETRFNSQPPAPADYQITAVNDPYQCTDLSSDPAMISVYRRPLPATNLRFLTECPTGGASSAPLAIMFDGREPSLESQAMDATLIHAQAKSAPSATQIAQIVSFETGIYDAQIADNDAGNLDADGANGGPVNLSGQNFYIGINDVLGADPIAPNVFTPDVFSLYDAWANPPASSGNDAARQAIARGEALFNNKQFTISRVNGLNLFPFDPLGTADFTGSCSTCHDSPNVGNHSLKLALNIGTSDAAAPVLDTSGLPVFTISCTDATGPLSGQVFQVTDPGRALISGNCADVGKVKGPILHGLAARAPYFHNGSAATLGDVVNFYDQRFQIGFSDQETADLVAFLKAL
jgi:cytochrome c peroxidase